MWIKRDFENFLASFKPAEAHPVKVLKGPRQVGKTSLLEHLGQHTLVQFDDFQTRERASENPRFFLDQFKGPLLLDEATLVPNLFLELKRRVDEARRQRLKEKESEDINVWITGSNQTLLEQSVQESLAGRASYFDFNTLSIHELINFSLSEVMLKGGWPALHADSQLSPVRYLNDLIATFIERDIVSAAGIERKSAFTKTTALLAGRVGQLFNASDIARNVGVETTTIQSWVGKLQQNAIIRVVQPYFNNLNQRLIKTPKVYFEDIGLATRLQGWTEYGPLYLSPVFGHLLENLALIEICRYFTNCGQSPEVFFLRSKEKVEVDFLIKLTNNRWLAIEAKSSPIDFSKKQLELLEQSGLNIAERWVAVPDSSQQTFTNSRIVKFDSLHAELERISTNVSL